MFKKIVASVMLGAMLLVSSGCGKDYTDPKTNKTYETRGFINGKEPGVKYEVSTGNVIWTVLLGGGIVFPVYFLGFSIWNPIGVETPTTPAPVK